MNLFWIWASGSGDVVKKISYLELCPPSYSAEQNYLCNFERGHHGEHSCEVIWNLDQWFRRRCCLKIFLIWNSGGPFIKQRGNICAISVESIMINNSVKNFEFRPVVQEKMPFKDISYLELWWPFCSVAQNHFGNFGRGHNEEQFCEII